MTLGGCEPPNFTFFEELTDFDFGFGLDFVINFVMNFDGMNTEETTTTAR